jgi:hypothetical protein
MSEKTLLVIVPESTVNYDSLFYLIVEETGECLASHLCSHAGYAEYDLYSGRPERVDEFRKRFGEVEVKFIDKTEISNEEILEKNKTWFNNLSK